MGTLQSSGAISFSDMQTQLGGANPISLSEYYRGGSYVPTSGTTYEPASGWYANDSYRITITYQGGGGT